MFKIFKSKRESEARSKAIKPVVLVVLDGFGLAPPSAGNAITRAKTPNLDRFYSLYPHGELIAAGESVGLPANEAGNSEVGHLTIGAGRVVYQSLKRIRMAIEDEAFFKNEAFGKTVGHVAKFSSKLHIMGLASSGNVHSSMVHLYALLKFCKKVNLQKVFLHIFTDGRDAPPQDGLELAAKLEEYLRKSGIGQIATISGRYYAMDRDARWERTQKAYEAQVLGRGIFASGSIEAIRGAYDQNQTDEFIEPTVITRNNIPIATVDDNDACIFFNFRSDRPRQLTMVYVLPNFEELREIEFGYATDQGRREKQVVKGPTFKREKRPKNLFFTTMTEYQKGLPVSAVAFPPLVVTETLPEILSRKGLKQMHMAESEKERMVTFYFDGLREEKFPGEDVLIVPSPKVPTYDKKPAMSAFKLVKKLKRELKKGKYHFFALNFANPDMVAHSGDIDATVKAIEETDKALGQLAKEVLLYGGCVVITADHGNAEELLTFPTRTFFFTTAEGSVNTEHSNNPVPVMIIRSDFSKNPRRLVKGALNDVAPTILYLMGLTQPQAMTGRNLLGEQKT